MLILPCSRCPGLHLIEESLWIVMATMLATTDLSKAVDAEGKTVEPDVTFDNSVFQYVLNLCFPWLHAHHRLSQHTFSVQMRRPPTVRASPRTYPARRLNFSCRHRHLLRPWGRIPRGLPTFLPMRGLLVYWDKTWIMQTSKPTAV